MKYIKTKKKKMNHLDSAVKYLDVTKAGLCPQKSFQASM